MIVIVKDSARPEQIEKLKENFESMGLQVHFSKGMNTTLLGLVGDTTSVDIGKIASLDIVEEVKRIQEPYKKANRKFHPEDSVVDVNGVKIGGGSPDKFEKYLRMQMKHIDKEYLNDYLFMFAWNEWGEGGYLEPDEKNEYKYLQAIYNALFL